MSEQPINSVPWPFPLNIEIVDITFKNLADGTVLVTWTYQRKA
jgi:hypothetical protein